MSNLHRWKTKGKHLAAEYVACMPVRGLEDTGNYNRMREIQDEIEIKRK